MLSCRDPGGRRVEVTTLRASAIPGRRFRARCSILLALTFSPFLPFRVEAANTETTLGVRASAEYDDNVTLVSTPDGDRGSDVVLHISPQIGFKLPHRDHSFSFSLNADYRRGTDTDIEDLNFTGAAGIELNLRNGLKLSLSDTYTQTAFDQELQEETGTPDGDRNALTVGAVYVPVDRFQVAATYQQQRQVFDKSGTESAADRDTDSFEASVTIPLTRSIVSTIRYSSEELASPQRSDRDYADDAYTLGARWQGPSRFVVWLELGEQTVDFATPGQSDFDDVTAKFGTEVKITESLNGRAAVGRGGFGEMVYDGSLSYGNDAGRQVSLTFGHDTQPSFSFVFESSIVQTSRVDLSFSSKLAERFSFTLGAGYQTQESVLSTEERDDQAWNGDLNIGYPVQEWFSLGFSYQYARRTSSLESFDFTNNRIGIFGSFTR